MTLSRRLLVVLLTVVLITALVVAVAVEWRLRQSLAPIGFERQLSTLRLAGQMLTDEADRARIDVQAALIAPHDAVLAARAAGQTPRESDVDQVELTLHALLRSHGEHLQLRLIDARGDEVVRVERTASGGPIVTVPADRLQNKGDRPYFKTAMTLERGATSLSPIELNQEFGRVQVPHVPKAAQRGPGRRRAGRSARHRRAQLGSAQHARAGARGRCSRRRHVPARCRRQRTAAS